MRISDCSSDVCSSDLQARDDILEALGARALVAEVGIARVIGLGALRGVVQRRRRGVERAPPGHELLLPELREGLVIVLALQRAILTLVEPPGASPPAPGPDGRRAGTPGRSTAARAVGV